MDAGGGMQMVASPTFKGNGLAYDVDGSLLVCEQVSSCLTRIHDDGRRELVAWHRDGVYLNSPNDVVVRACSTAASTSPIPDYGRWNDWIGCKREFVRDVKGVYRVPPGGGPVELVVRTRTSSSSPTACASRPTSRSSTSTTRRAPRSRRSTSIADGSLGPCRMFRDGIGRGDDERGQPRRHGVRRARQHLDVRTRRGVGARTPTGERIGAIRTPEICGSVVFGGPDLTTLFLTTTDVGAHDADQGRSSAPLPGPA